jgi:hypothetical protein
MKTITINFINPTSLECAAMRYTNNNGKHIVTRHLAAGADIAPTVWRFDEVNQARQTWAREVAALKSNGMSPR